MDKLPIKGFDGYYVIGDKVYSRRLGYPLKTEKNDIVRLWRNCKSNGFSRAKVVWCANNGVDPTTIPRIYAFTINGGVAVCELFSDKMSKLKTGSPEIYNVEITKGDYRTMMAFSSMALQVLSGDAIAKANLYSFLHSYRAELASYAVTAVGGVGTKRAFDLADDAIQLTYDVIVTGKRAIPNPIGFMKKKVNGLIMESRKSVDVQDKFYITKKL